MSKGNWFITAVLLAGLSGCASQKTESAGDDSLNSTKATDFNYAQLQIKDLNEMQAVVNRQIKKADQFLKEDSEQQAVVALMSALQYVLSRPNRDNMVSQLVPPLRSKLRELDALETSINNIVEVAIDKIKNKKNHAGARATQYFVLENTLSEFRPETAVNEEMKKIFAKIRDAKIELDSSVINDMKMRAMVGRPESPSVLAAKIIGPARAK